MGPCVSVSVSNMAKWQRCTDRQQQHAVAAGQVRPGQRPHSGAGLRAQYTSPNGLSFVYQDYKLCLVDKERDMLHILKEGVAPPTTGLRAQFILGTQSSCSTASVAEDMTCTCPNRLEAVPDTVLQHIGQQILHDAASEDAECEAAVAAASLACTGSRAALIIAHAVWALLDPDIVKPNKHVQMLQLSQSAADSASSKPAWKVSRTQKKRRRKAQQKWHAAVAALCNLADPLQCPLSTKVECVQRRHRALAAQQRLSLFNLTVDTLPCECGIKESMKTWIHTGCLDDINQGIISAAQKIMVRTRRLHELQVAGSAYKGLLSRQVLDKYQQCRDYVETGIGIAESIMSQVCLEDIKRRLDILERKYTE